MKDCYIVFETGAGVIHGVYYEYAEAEKATKELEKETGFYCFEILKTTIQ